MRLLTPHFQQALEISTRLRNAAHATTTFEQSLDWLDEGVALLGRDGRIVSSNTAFARMTSACDGVHTLDGEIAFEARGAQSRLAKALAAASRLSNGNADDTTALSDFPVERPSGAPAYIVSLRPLAGRVAPPAGAEKAVSILFIRDPLARSAAAMRLLRELFDLTAAEAALGHALQRGVSPIIYARESGLSPNTVYTHLRRLKEKTGCSSVTELSRKLNELRVPL